jgi:hypothetical protein
LKQDHLEEERWREEKKIKFLDRKEPDVMDLFPNEVFRLILSFLPSSILLLGKSCCKRWKFLAEDLLDTCPVEVGFANDIKYYNDLMIKTHRGDKKPYLIVINVGRLRKNWLNHASSCGHYIIESIFQGMGEWIRRQTIFPFLIQFPRCLIWFDRDKNMRLIEKTEIISTNFDIKYTFVVKQSERGTSWISEVRAVRYSKNHNEYNLGYINGYSKYTFPNGNLDSYLSDYLKQRFMNLLTFRDDKVTFCLIKPRKNRFMIRKKFLDEYKVPDFGIVPEMML